MGLREILEPLVEGPLAPWAKTPIERMFLGLHFSLTRLSTGHVGIAFLPREEAVPVEHSLYGERPTLRTLLRYADTSISTRSLALSGVVAATNAWIESTPEPGIHVQKKPLHELVDLKKGDLVLIVGYMRPIVREFLAAGARVVVAEKSRVMRLLGSEEEKAEFIDEYEALDVAGKADILIVTGSSLLYPQLLTRLLKEASSAKCRALIGPTASLHPKIMDVLGLDLLGGSYIHRSVSHIVERIVELGGGYHSFKDHLVKWVVKRET
ncbi:MAG TPA: hypothetical protein EYH08_06300 [Pyrodictium sp.]|nr:hypothetical protein [Pyrodictium sp.]